MNTIANRLITAATCTLLFTSASIGGCKGESDEEVSVAVKESNLCNEVAEVLCNNVFACCTGLDIEERLGLKQTVSEGECRRDLTLRCEQQNAELLYAIDRMTVVVDTARATACLESMVVPDEQCFPVTAAPPYQIACDESVIQGQQAAGSPCIYSFECVKDTYCGPDRICRPYLTQGQDCGAQGQCASDLYCAWDDDSTCQLRRGAGEECNSSSQCRDELFCDTNDALTGTCSALKALGESCDDDYVCDSGECLPGTCSDGMTTCYSERECEGRCAESGNDCSSSADCGGRCSDSGWNCDQDGDCGGECVNSGYSCSDDAECQAYDATDTCLVEPCIQDSCVGSGSCSGGQVCVEHYVRIDYCKLDPGAMLGVGNATSSWGTAK